MFILFITIGISFCFIPSCKKNAIKIPVIFTVNPYNPLIKSTIQGKDYTLLVDSGASENLYLDENVFDQVKKGELKRTLKIYDLRGNFYNWETYSISDVKVGPIDLFNYEVVKESPDFNENTALWTFIKNPKNRDSHGRIGWQFFENYCTLFDFPNSSIFIAKKIEELKKEGVLKIENFIPIPFAIQEGALVLSIQTALGKHQVILDTGATFCTLRATKVPLNKIKQSPSGKCYFPSSKLIFGDCDFGDWKFAVTDITELSSVDGVLGTDFFLEHAVYFDFANKIAYIKKPEGSIATQWRRCKYYLTQFFLRNFSDLPKVENV